MYCVLASLSHWPITTSLVTTYTIISHVMLSCGIIRLRKHTRAIALCWRINSLAISCWHHIYRGHTLLAKLLLPIWYRTKQFLHSKKPWWCIIWHVWLIKWTPEGSRDESSWLTYTSFAVELNTHPWGPLVCCYYCLLVYYGKCYYMLWTRCNMEGRIHSSDLYHSVP